MSTWVLKHLRGDDPETFADALIVVEQLAQSLNNMLKERKKHPGWSTDLLAIAAERYLNEYRDGPK